MRISISSIRCFKSCRRLWELQYKEDLQVVNKREALETGVSYHNKIDEIYKNGYFTPENDEDAFSKTSAMALAYEKYIYPKFKVDKAEEWFTIKLNDKHTLVGRYDGISDGYIVEHKTTSGAIDESYEYGLEWDEQILAYMLASGKRKIFYTVVKKPTIRLCKNETEEDFFNRMCKWYDEDTDSKIKVLEITRTDEEVESFRDELIKMADEMENCTNFYKVPSHCKMWGTMCEFAPICKHYDPNQDYIEFKRREYN